LLLRKEPGRGEEEKKGNSSYESHAAVQSRVV
jgi:hypothetical protein